MNDKTFHFDHTEDRGSNPLVVIVIVLAAVFISCVALASLVASVVCC